MPLSANTRLAEVIVENTKSYAIIGLHSDGVVTHWLGGAEDLTGYTSDEMVGRAFACLFTEPDRAADAPSAEIAQALREGRAEDSRWHRRKDGALFWANGLTLCLDEAERKLVKIFRDETPAKRAEEQRVLLLNELNHRVKNTLATVQSITERTLRAAGVSDSIRCDLTERLVALARSHNVLVAQNWAGADLEALLREGLKPHAHHPSPFRLEGPAVRLHPAQAVSLALAVHELTTNAVKHGALSVAEGRVELSWNMAHNGEGTRFLTLLWTETGGPEVTPPARTGFGTQLLSRVIGSRTTGSSRLDFDPSGLRCVIQIRLTDEVATGLEV
jgi:PAS domain S-box-containing protein